LTVDSQCCQAQKNRPDFTPGGLEKKGEEREAMFAPQGDFILGSCMNPKVSGLQVKSSVPDRSEMGAVVSRIGLSLR